MRLALPWSKCLAALLLIPLFCLPALYNHHPVLYPDSVGYFHSGSAALEALEPAESAFVDMVEAKAHAAAPLSSPHAHPAGKTMAERSLDGTSTSRSPYYGVLLVILTRLGGEWALPLVQVALSIMAIMLAARHLGRPRALALFSICAATGLIGGLGIFSDRHARCVFRIGDPRHSPSHRGLRINVGEGTMLLARPAPGELPFS